MQPTIVVKSNNETVKKEREYLAQRVIEACGDRLPESRLLCFFDDQDWSKFKGGEATRGLYSPVNNDLFEHSPEYVKKELLTTRPSGLSVDAFDHLIYVHGTTCSTRVGLTLTFAHELHHFRQYMNTPLLWAASSLIPQLKKETLRDLG